MFKSDDSVIKASDRLIQRIIKHSKETGIELESIACIGLNTNTGWYEISYATKGKLLNFIAFAIRKVDGNVIITKTHGLSEFNLVELDIGY